MQHKMINLDAYNLFHQGIIAFAKAEANGMRIDVSYCKLKKKELTEKINLLEKQFNETKLARKWRHKNGVKTNFNSNHQLSNLLFKYMRVEPVGYTVSGNPSTDNESLSQLNVLGLDLILELRRLKKIRDTYLEGILREQVDGWLHPFFNLHLARTFRSSSDHINFQNLPKRDKEAMDIVRRAIIPRKGHQLLESDYSGIEVRVSACYHQDPVMIKYIEDDTTDMHRDICKQIYILDNDQWTKEARFYAKNGFVFPEFYGDYYVNCAKEMWKAISQAGLKTKKGIPLKKHLRKHNIKGYKDFENHVKSVEDHFWNERFKVYRDWKEEQWERYLKSGYIDMFTGFRCSGVMGINEVTNYPIQGSAFHCLLWSFIQINKYLEDYKWNTKLIGQIHDSMVFDVDPNEIDDLLPLIRRITCIDLPKKWQWIIVPLEIDADLSPIDAPWSEREEIKI
jgi:DNA polymerase-1